MLKMSLLLRIPFVISRPDSDSPPRSQRLSAAAEVSELGELSELSVATYLSTAASANQAWLAATADVRRALMESNRETSECTVSFQSNFSDYYRTLLKGLSTRCSGATEPFRRVPTRGS